MKLFSMFSRPAWESADADKRARAVASLHDAALIARLPDIARHDADAKVRLAAVKRIDDLSLLGDRARLDLSPEVRDAAGARLRHLLLDTKLPLESRVRIVRVTDNTALLELIAVEGVETDLRACALERIRRVPFLAERCVKDSDAQLRLALLERIDDAAQLERIAERARKTDKQLSRLARERVLTAKLAAGDAVAIEARANELCAALDALLRARGDDAEARVAQIEADWSRLAIADDASVARRFRGLLDTLRHVLNPPPKPVPAVPVEATPTPVPEPEAVVESIAAPNAPDPLAEAAKAEADAAREAEQAQRRLWRDRVHAAISSYAAALDAGKFSEARAARAELQQIEAGWPRSQWEDTKRLAQLDTQFAKLEHWQQWSSRDQKKRLCDAAEALIGSGMHPDALITRVRELQGEWDRLVAGEAPEAADGLARRFRALIHQSVAPARPYLEKRKELRSEKGRAVAEFLDAAEAALADAALALPQLLEWRSKLNDAGAQVAELVGSDRRDAGARRKRLADDVHARIETFNSGATEAKQKLIAQLRRQLASADVREQVHIAKAVMPQWKALPRAQRKTEDALWNELRALIDPVFERDRAEHDRERGQRQAQQQAVADTLAALETLVEAELGADALRHQASDLRQRFQALQRSREDDLAFDRVHAKIELRIAGLRAGQAQAQRQHVREQAGRLAQIEQRIVDAATADDLEADLQSLSNATELANRIAAARAARDDETRRRALSESIADTDTLAELAIRAELAAGLPSPEAWREQRRALQMTRLADKLGGGASNRNDDVAALWRQWLTLPGTGLAVRSGFDARIEAALVAMWNSPA